MLDKDIYINGYNVYRTACPRKGGGVAMYIRSNFDVNFVLKVSVSKELELLALEIELTKNHRIMLVGCYRPPSVPKNVLSSLVKFLSQLKYSKLLLVGDLNWDWFMCPVSDDLKAQCDSLNLTQFINSPTRPNPKCSQKATLIDLVLTNMPSKYVTTGVFPNDLSDHCVIAVVRDTRLPKSKPRFVEKRNMKMFVEQAFLHDLYHFDWERIALFDDVELAWSYFHESFSHTMNKHAPLRKFRIKGCDNTWFTTELAEVLHERNCAWARARKSGLETDWLYFRQLRNKFTSLLRRTKAEFYLSMTTESLKNPKKLWKAIFIVYL